MDDTTRAPPSALLGMQFVAQWRAMQPVDQGRPWRWGRHDMAALRDSLNDAKRDILNELQPAGKAAVRDAYEKLAAVYQSKGAENAAQRVVMWVETFENWPLCALKAAVKAWSLKDTAFMPTPGQFNACGEHVIEEKRADLGDVRRIIGLMDKPEDKDWDSFVPDPEVARKLKRLMTGLRNGEDLRALRQRGEI